MRAGFAPWCADLFADADLRKACPVRHVAADDYPKGLIDAFQDAPAAPWMYTGALENRPDIVAKIERPLWGNPPEVLRRMRSPRLVHDCLRHHDLPCPALANDEPDPHRRWLVKLLRGAAGQGIRFWKPGQTIDRRRLYVQEWIDGESGSAIFVAHGGATMLLGATWQLVGEPWLGAALFHYCGSVGPIALPEQSAAMLRRIGETLVDEFRLRGLFGVDFIVRDGVPFPVEINPRYTASVEVLERATGRAFLTWHAAAFAAASIDSNEPPIGARFVAKGIVFARRALMFPERGPWEDALRMSLADRAVPFADIPAPGTWIEAGQPICTMFVEGDCAETCLSGLRDVSRDLDRVLYA